MGLISWQALLWGDDGQQTGSLYLRTHTCQCLNIISLEKEPSLSLPEERVYVWHTGGRIREEGCCWWWSVCWRRGGKGHCWIKGDKLIVSTTLHMRNNVGPQQSGYIRRKYYERINRLNSSWKWIKFKGGGEKIKRLKTKYNILHNRNKSFPVSFWLVL